MVQLLVVLVVMNSPTNAGDKRDRFNPRVRKIPWRRAWKPSAAFLPGESHGQRSVVGYSHRVAKNHTQLKQLSTHHREQYRSFFKKLKIELPYNPVIPLLSIYPEKSMV